jgi:hypothetical protein
MGDGPFPSAAKRSSGPCAPSQTAAGHVDKSLYTSVQVEPTETFLSYVNSAGGAPAAAQRLPACSLVVC